MSKRHNAQGKHGMSISQIMLENEKAWRTEVEIRAGLLRIWEVMQDCVRRGITSEGILPGGRMHALSPAPTTKA